MNVIVRGREREVIRLGEYKLVKCTGLTGTETWIMGMGLGLQATLIQFVLLTPSPLFLHYCTRPTPL